MMKPNSLIAPVLVRLLAVSVIMDPPPVPAQSTSWLRIHTIEISPGAPTRFLFTDQGTGATNYTVEFSPAAGAGSSWSNLGGALITGLGGGNFQVVAPDPQTPTGFFRVRGHGGAVVASFATTAFQVSEGATVAPTITFNAPFFGLLRYTVSGTVGSGDYATLSGEIRVNGTTATIPVELLENTGIGQLKHLTLTLEAGAGYRLGASSQTTIVIDENDADWQGTFSTANAALPFVLRIQRGTSGHLATLRSDGFGFFPTNEVPAALTFDEDTFAATIQNIPVAPGASLLNAAMSLTFRLNAANGRPNQAVSSTRIQGDAELVTDVSGKAYLRTTNRGTFLLLRPLVAPSTNQIDLVNSP